MSLDRRYICFSFYFYVVLRFLLSAGLQSGSLLTGSFSTSSPLMGKRLYL